MIDSLNAGIFPKAPNSYCGFCDYFEACAKMREDRPLSFTDPVEEIEQSNMFEAATGLVRLVPKQLRFPSSKFKAPRQKKAEKEDKPRKPRNSFTADK